MADRNVCSSCSVSGSQKDTICVDVNRIYDSCRDKDCFENTRVYLTECGQDIVDKTSNIRVKSAHMLWTQLNVEPVQFNRGFYQVYVRFYVKLCFEGCTCPGKPQEFEGVAVCEKKVILFGSEGCVSIFRSNPEEGAFCPADLDKRTSGDTNLPIAVCEVAAPVVLDVDVVERRSGCCCCCCCAEDIPSGVACAVNGPITDAYEDGKILVCTLGFFSVIRMERPAQYIINAAEYAVPDKECVAAEENDPCALFRRMAFPVGEFSPPSCREFNK